MQFNNNPAFQFENSIQTGLMNRFTTGNPFIDPFVHMFIYSLVGILVFNLKNILNLSNINYYFWYFFGPIYDRITKLFKKDSAIIDKHVTIDYITDNRKVNNLYKAIDWYLSSKCTDDLIKETPLMMSFEDDLD